MKLKLSMVQFRRFCIFWGSQKIGYFCCYPHKTEINNKFINDFLTNNKKKKKFFFDAAQFINIELNGKKKFVSFIWISVWNVKQAMRTELDNCSTEIENNTVKKKNVGWMTMGFSRICLCGNSLFGYKNYVNDKFL